MKLATDLVVGGETILVSPTIANEAATLTDMTHGPLAYGQLAVKCLDRVGPQNSMG
jgi:hypothetical protein